MTSMPSEPSVQVSLRLETFAAFCDVCRRMLAYDDVFMYAFERCSDALSLSAGRDSAPHQVSLWQVGGALGGN
jgi:hypothetical protein